MDWKSNSAPFLHSKFEIGLPEVEKTHIVIVGRITPNKI